MNDNAKTNAENNLDLSSNINKTNNTNNTAAGLNMPLTEIPLTDSEILVKSIYYPEGVAVEKSKILEFVKPILGFNDLKKYCILNINKEI